MIDIWACVETLRLLVIELLYLEGFWFVLEDFCLKIVFLQGEIFEFS